MPGDERLRVQDGWPGNRSKSIRSLRRDANPCRGPAGAGAGTSLTVRDQPVTRGGVPWPLQDLSDAVASFDLPTVLRFAELALAALGEAREEIDALNVYPVPDGDTGTNMFLTFEAARDAMLDALGDRRAPDGDLRVAMTAFARGALLGARGNSGVILSQLVGALCKRLAAAGPDDRSAAVFADGHGAGHRGQLRRRRPAGRGHHPVGGPGRGRGGRRGRRRRPDEAARPRGPRRGRRPPATALARTPEQLQTLKDAGVVDAGGRGLCVVLDAAETAVTGRRPVSAPAPLGAHAIPVPLPTRRPHARRAVVRGDVPARRRRRPDPGAAHRAGPARRLAGGGRRRRAVERPRARRRRRRRGRGRHRGRPAAPGPGHPLRRAGTRAARGRTAGRAARSSPSRPAPGSGTCSSQAGATVVPGGPGRRPSTGQIVEAVTSAGAAEVIVLPNDRDSIAAAEAAARTVRETGDVRVAVIPHRRAGAGAGRARRARARPHLRAGHRRDDRGGAARPLRRGDRRRRGRR